MNRKEELAFHRLEAENFRLKEANSKHMKVYADQCADIVTMRIKLDMVESLVQELFNEVKS